MFGKVQGKTWGKDKRCKGAEEAVLCPAYGADKEKGLWEYPSGWEMPGTVMPVSGEGIYYSIMSGNLAAEAVIKGDFASYEREWKRVYGSQFRLMSLLRQWLYRDDKWREARQDT